MWQLYAFRHQDNCLILEGAEISMTGVGYEPMVSVMTSGGTCLEREKASFDHFLDKMEGGLSKYQDPFEIRNLGGSTSLGIFDP